MKSKIKDSMLSLDINAWIKENKDAIEGGYIKKIYQVGEKEFLMKIYKDKTRSLYINLNGFIYFADKETPDTPSMFAMYLRKRFSNKKIFGFRQLNFDRIVEFDMGEYVLIVELFGGGNIIVTRDGIIERAYVEREWRHRSILKGYEYAAPPAKRNPEGDIEDLCEVLNSSTKDVVRTIATEFNLGNYAEEVCYRANVDKSKKGVSEEECSRLKIAIKDMFVFDGCFLYKDYFSPVELHHRDDLVGKYESMNSCLEEYTKRFENGMSGESIKLQVIKEMQLKKIEEFKREEDINRKIGDTIYAHFMEIQELIETARTGKVKLEKKGKIKVNYDGLEFELDITKSPGDNATVYYEKAKKAREKIKGAMSAINEIDEKIKKESKKKKKVKKKKSRRRFWFEKYRWFISSEGILVVAGKDAKTNEEVVKKHLGDKDLYMHADIHGAPSLVIKSEGKEIGDITLKEAAQFAVSMSKAWNAGFGSMSAYWVYPSQVSKMGESGEYVARGAWVIHGKRNYIHNVPLQLAVGKIEYQGTEMLMCGPVDSVISRTEKYMVIEPGDEKKEKIARVIADKFGEPTDDVLPILPPGKTKIVRET